MGLESNQYMYRGILKIRFFDVVQTPNGKEFKLINLPFYYVGMLDLILGKYVD